jgi:hypothetical protein
VTLEKEYIELFKSTVQAERLIDGATARIYDNRIYHLAVPKYKKITMDFVEKGYEFINSAGGGRYYNVFEFSSFSDIEPEVRDWAADKDKNFNTYSDAIVIGSLSQKIIADFYMRFNKPVKPTKFFYSLESAIAWTFEQMEKDNKPK